MEQEPKTKRNVFMGSMYFFIPLKKLSHKYIQLFKKEQWITITPPPFIQNQSSLCEFIEWPFDKELTYYYASHTMCGYKRIIRKVRLNSYILRYIPDKGKNSHKYLFVVGVSIDKLFTPCKEDDGTPLLDLLCTRNDIVFLKKAFYENGTRGLFATDRHHQKDFHQWLDCTIEKISGIKHNCVQPTYSVVDIIGIDIDDNCWSTKKMLDEVFSREYYSPNTPTVEKALSGNIQRFAYGILFGNDNYERLPMRECHDVLNHGYSNNISEITYAANNTILFLHTHRSYLFNPKNLNRQKRQNCLLNGTQNVLEMCDVIFAKQKIRCFQSRLKDSGATMIKETLLSISRFISSDLFNLSELDRKMEYIYHGLGIYKEFENLMKAGDLAASEEEIKATQKTNTYIILLAIITAVLTFIQIFLNH